MKTGVKLQKLLKKAYQTQSNLSPKQVREVYEAFVEKGINIEAIPDAVSMVYSKQKKHVDVVFRGRGSAVEKVGSLNTKEIAVGNEGNVNFHKALLETKRSHLNDGLGKGGNNIVSVDYKLIIFLEKEV